jgi:hypothetical protein
VQSRGRATRVIRIGSMLVIVLLAFAAGLALRGSDDESGTAAPAPPTRVDEVGVERSIRLVRADPGTLHRPERAPTPVAASAPAAPAAPPVLESGPAVTPPPVSAPTPEPSAEPEPAPAATPIGTFDSEG